MTPGNKTPQYARILGVRASQASPTLLSRTLGNFRREFGKVTKHVRCRDKLVAIYRPKGRKPQFVFWLYLLGTAKGRNPAKLAIIVPNEGFFETLCTISDLTCKQISISTKI